MGKRRRVPGIRIKYAFIKAHRREFETAVMCRLLDVSRNGFYEWLRNPPLRSSVGGSAVAQPDPRGLCGEPRRLRGPADLSRFARSGRDL